MIATGSPRVSRSGGPGAVADHHRVRSPAREPSGHRSRTRRPAVPPHAVSGGGVSLAIAGAVSGPVTVMPSTSPAMCCSCGKSLYPNTTGVAAGDCPGSHGRGCGSGATNVRPPADSTPSPTSWRLQVFGDDDRRRRRRAIDLDVIVAVLHDTEVLAMQVKRMLTARGVHPSPAHRFADAIPEALGVRPRAAIDGIRIKAGRPPPTGNG